MRGMLEKLKQLLTKATSALEQEESVLRMMHPDVRSALKRLYALDPGLEPLLKKAHAYAVFPSVGRAAAVVGGAFGKGEVFKGNELVGYAAVGQLTLGVQLGGETLVEVIAFESKPVFERFKQGKLAFAANASAALVKAGAAASARYEKGAAVFVHSEGGMMLELAIGAQKLVFKPAALGRVTKSAPTRPGQKRKASRKAPSTARRSRARRSKARS